MLGALYDCLRSLAMGLKKGLPFPTIDRPFYSCITDGREWRIVRITTDSSLAVIISYSKGFSLFSKLTLDPSSVKYLASLMIWFSDLLLKASAEPKELNFQDDNGTRLKLLCGACLGGGRFSLVYSLSSVTLSNSLCGKIILFEREHYVREVTAWKKITSLESHPNIPSLLYSGTLLETNQPMLISNVVGRPLHSLLPLSSELQTILFNSIFSALNLVHQVGFVYCDLNPGNVIWDENMDHFYLIDFGAVQEIGKTTWQTICSLPFASVSYSLGEKPQPLDDIESLIYLLYYVALRGDLPWKLLPLLDLTCSKINFLESLMTPSLDLIQKPILPVTSYSPLMLPRIKSRVSTTMDLYKHGQLWRIE